MLIDLQPAAGPALVVGGGGIAARRVKLLVESEFEIVVVAPAIREEISLAPFVTVHRRPFAANDLAMHSFSLVMACTDDRDVNREVGRLARAARIPVVVADAQEESTFFTPATIRDGDLAVAVSTGGASPGLARQFREKIAASVGQDWGRLVYAARQERQVRTAARLAATRAGERSLVLLAHGSEKDAGARMAVEEHAERLRERAVFGRVAVGFWKHPPSFLEALSACAGTPVTVVPLFMAEGFYTAEVIPREVATLTPIAGLKAQPVTIARPIGTHERMADAIVARAREAGATPADTLVVLGHGTPRNPRSGDSTYEQAARIRGRGEFASVVELFLDQEPSLAEVRGIARTSRAVIVPFFLTDGWHAGQQVPSELASEVRSGRVIYAEAAGTHALVTEVILDLAKAMVPAHG
jgi:siroheme synthase-like protein